MSSSFRLHVANSGRFHMQDIIPMMAQDEPCRYAVDARLYDQDVSTTSMMDPFFSNTLHLLRF
jgi:hypothetical protein